VITNPIIPINTMIIICVVLVVVVIIKPGGLFSVIRQILLIGLLFTINLRIMEPNGTEKSLSDNLDVIFVVDNTISMLAEDYIGNQTRLSGIINDCKYIVSKLSSSKFSIVTFDNDARVVVPFTYDINMINQYFSMLTPVIPRDAKGSFLTLPIEIVKEELVSSSKDSERAQIVFYISDGEVKDLENLSAFSEWKKYIDEGAVLGYGTSKGGNMKNMSSYYSVKDYIIDGRTNQKALSKINEKNLKSIASSMNVDYIHMSNTANISKKIEDIKNLKKLDFDENEIKYYKDLYPRYVLPFVVLLGLDFLCFKRRLK